MAKLVDEKSEWEISLMLQNPNVLQGNLINSIDGISEMSEIAGYNEVNSLDTLKEMNTLSQEV